MFQVCIKDLLEGCWECERRGTEIPGVWDLWWQQQYFPGFGSLKLVSVFSFCLQSLCIWTETDSLCSFLERWGFGHLFFRCLHVCRVTWMLCFHLCPAGEERRARAYDSRLVVLCVCHLHVSFFFFNFVLLFNKVSRSSLKGPRNVNSFNIGSPGHHLLHLGERGDCDSKKACVSMLRFGPFFGLASQQTVSEKMKSTPDSGSHKHNHGSPCSHSG